MKLTSRIFLLVGITVLMSGCKLAVIVVEGGDVQSTSSGTCVAGTICIVDVTDPNFSETFTAVPDEGWYFQKWNSGDGFFCTGFTYPTCRLSFQGHEESKAVADMVASSETFYLMPIFKPVPDIITVEGKEWYQPYLFLNLSWSDINAVCPEGLCDGTLKGYDMTGWTWASVDDVNALFNYYIGTDALGPGPDRYRDDFDSAWAPAFFENGWHDPLPPLPNDQARAILGWVRDMSGPEESYYCIIADVLYPEGFAYNDVAGTNSTRDIDIRSDNWIGGWFHRAP